MVSVLIICERENVSCETFSLFVYTMSRVDMYACIQLSIWRMYIIELISEMSTGYVIE